MLTQPSKKEKEEFLLPTEVIMEILSKLPTMSVLRFHCVSKRWFGILRDEYFHNLHSEALLWSGSPFPSYAKFIFSTVQIQEQQPIITFSSPRSTSHHTIKISPHTDDRDAVSPAALNYMWWPVMQCNGLLCMVPHKRLMTRPIIVCNPLTIEYLALRPCTTSSKALSSSFGLGFAPLAKQYKVVCIHLVNAPPFEQPNFPPVLEVVLEVCNLGDIMWRVVDSHADFKPWCCQAVGLYADGKIYWVMQGPRPIRYRLFSFDVESEKGNVMGDLPSTAAGIENKLSDFRLVRLGSGVSLFMNHGPVIEVWMLKQYCSSNNSNCLWDMREKISLPDDFVGAGGEMPVRWRLHGAWEFGDEDLVIGLQFFATFEITKKIFFYHISSSTRRCKCARCPVDYLPKIKLAWSPLFGYRPSLVSLKRYQCFTGEKVVDGDLETPPNLQIPPST